MSDGFECPICHQVYDDPDDAEACEKVGLVCEFQGKKGDYILVDFDDVDENENEVAVHALALVTGFATDEHDMFPCAEFLSGPLSGEIHTLDESFDITGTLTKSRAKDFLTNMILDLVREVEKLDKAVQRLEE